MNHREEIIIRNSKLKILLNYGIPLFLGLLAELIWGFQDDFERLWEINRPVAYIVFAVFGLFLGSGVFDLLDRRPKLKISADGITINKRKLEWSKISRVDVKWTHSTRTTHTYVIVYTISQKKLRLEITDFELEGFEICEAINRLTEKDLCTVSNNH